MSSASAVRRSPLRALGLASFAAVAALVGCGAQPLGDGSKASEPAKSTASVVLPVGSSSALLSAVEGQAWVAHVPEPCPTRILFPNWGFVKSLASSLGAAERALLFMAAEIRQETLEAIEGGGVCAYDHRDGVLVILELRSSEARDAMIDEARLVVVDANGVPVAGARKPDEEKSLSEREMSYARPVGSNLLLIGDRSSIAQASTPREPSAELLARAADAKSQIVVDVDLSGSSLIGGLQGGSRAAARYGAGVGALELDLKGPSVPRLGEVLLESPRELMSRFSSAPVSFGFSLRRAPGKGFADLRREAARGSEWFEDKVDRELASVGLTVADLDAWVGGDAAIGVFSAEALLRGETPDVVVGLSVTDVASADRSVAAAKKSLEPRVKGLRARPGGFEFGGGGESVIVTRQRSELWIGYGKSQTLDARVKALVAAAPEGAKPTSLFSARGHAAWYVGPLVKGEPFNLDGSVLPNGDGLSLRFSGPSSVEALAKIGSGFILGSPGHMDLDPSEEQIEIWVRAAARGAIAAYEREAPPDARGSAHRLCKSALPVPAQVPKGHVVKVRSEKDKGFDTGDSERGWRCLRFNPGDPSTKHQLEYRAGGPYKGPSRGGPDPGPQGFEVSAEADFDGDGTTSLMTLTATFDPKKNEFVLAKEAFIDKPEE